MNLPSEIKELYPFKSNYLNLDGNNLHYIDEGEGDVILFVHGNPTWSFYYRNLISEFKKTNRVVALDHLGMGLSSKSLDYTYNLRSHIDNLKKLIVFLDLKKIILVVHDWGGAIGFGAATEMHERFQKFVILNTSAFFLNRLPLRIRLCRRPKMWAKFFVENLNGFAYPATFMASKRRLTHAEKKAYLFPYQNKKNRIGIFSFVQDIPMEVDHPTRKVIDNIETKLPMFCDRPVLIIWGGRDFCFNKKFYKKWQEIYPDATSIYFKDASHYVIEDKKDECIKLIRAFGV